MSAPTIGGLNVSGHQLVPRDRVFTCLDPRSLQQSLLKQILIGNFGAAITLNTSSETSTTPFTRYIMKHSTVTGSTCVQPGNCSSRVTAAELYKPFKL